MKIPNLLTLLRFILIIPIAISFFVPEWNIIAFFLLLAAWITDVFDGIIAKKFNQKSKVGAFMDPTVDKFLVLTIFVVLVDLNVIPFWIAILIIGRDFLVQAIRNLAKSKGKILKSEWSGKLKFGLQMLTFVTAAYSLSFQINMQIVYWVAIITLLESYYALAEFLYKNKTFLSVVN